MSTFGPRHLFAQSIAICLSFVLCLILTLARSLIPSFSFFLDLVSISLGLLFSSFPLVGQLSHFSPCHQSADGDRGNEIKSEI